MTAPLALNHFITDLHSPDQTSLEVLQGNITSLERKSTLFCVIEKVCYVALAAIMATAFAMSYNLIALGSVAAIALFLSTPVFIVAPAEFAKLSHQYARLAEAENRVALKLRDIQNWSLNDIQTFIANQGLQIRDINTEALRQINPQEPLKALLPLIARFIAMRDKTVEIQENRAEAIAQQEAHFARQEAEEGRLIPIYEKQKVRFENESTQWANLELRAIPLAIHSATALQIIQNPTREDLEIAPLSLTVPGLGRCDPQNYAQRMFAKTYTPLGYGRLNGEIVPLNSQNCANRSVEVIAPNQEIRDTYFVFNDPARAPITHEQIENAHMDPRLLRPMLFA